MSTRFGVEEEFLLVDAVTGRLAPVAAQVIAAVPAAIRPRLRLETRTTQIETTTSVLTRLTDLGPALAGLRAAVDGAARDLGCRLLAAGSCILPESGAFPVADSRNLRIVERFGRLEDPHGLSACHIHVEVPSRDVAIGVLNHIRVWLPVLQALSANSPYRSGRDGGYASTRATLLSAWPTVRPSPLLRSVTHHDELVAELIESGAMLDPTMLYWHARLSAVYPTVELRAADVCLSVREAVLLAALGRALVVTAIGDVRDGRPAPAVDEGTLTAAHWLAARDGVDGSGYDPVARERIPMWDLVDRLLAYAGPALEDPAATHAALDAMRVSGSAAARQRAAHRRGGLTEVVRLVIEEGNLGLS